MTEREHGDDAEREAERDAERSDRDARRAERDARREERHRIRAEIRGGLGEALGARIGDEVRRGMRGWRFGMTDFGGGAREFRVGSPGSPASEVEEKRFEVSGMPKVRVSNVAGEIDVTVGVPGEVFVRARKRVDGWSEERARRLLENVEIRMELEGDQIVIEPRMFEQERGWQELFRGGRVAVDFDLRVPREAQIEARTVSGEISVTGTRGPIEVQSVSGEVNVTDVQGPMRLRTVSGDASVSSYSGQLEANSVSGEIQIERSRVRAADIVAVSGDVELDALYASAGPAEARLKTVSGDVELALGEADAEIDFKTVSGDAEVDGPARVEKEGRRDRRIIVGAGGPHVRVKTVSGDLSIRMSKDGAPAAPPAAEGEPMPMDAPAPPAPSAAAREILERVARGELSVEDAAAALDAAR
jgi:hypothetical protein